MKAAASLWALCMLVGLFACTTDSPVLPPAVATTGVFQAAQALPQENTDTPEEGVSEFIINGQAINESSGLARSIRKPGMYWTHNDSGGNTAVYALSSQGGHVATFHLQGLGVTNLDWEDMTSAVLDGQPVLLVADVGDNNALRPFVTVYQMPEPEFEVARYGIVSDVVNVTAVYQLVFPDARPRDVESIAVDSATRTAYLISKREAQPRLFSFELNTKPLNSTVPVPGVLKDLGPINIPRAPAGFEGNPNSFNWVTTMDISADGRSVYVGTLMNGYVYARQASETIQQALSRSPKALRLPDYSQIEAGAFTSDARAVVITSENVPARMARIPVARP